LGEPKTELSRKRFSRTPEQTDFARRLRREASKTEKKIWPHLQADKMGASFRRQYSVDKYFADYCCRSLRLVIEVDGPMHGAARDAARDACVGRRGFDVVRFSVQEIDENLPGVIETIYGEVQLRLARRQVGLSARNGGG
jgi:very-short-patch-repair endonuclease